MKFECLRILSNLNCVHSVPCSLRTGVTSAAALIIHDVPSWSRSIVSGFTSPWKSSITVVTPAAVLAICGVLETWVSLGSSHIAIPTPFYLSIFP